MTKETLKNFTLGIDDLIPIGDPQSNDKKPAGKRQRKEQASSGNNLYIDLGSWRTRIGTSISNLTITDSIIPGDTKKSFKSLFERDILLNFSYLEKFLDSLFASLLSPNENGSCSLVMTVPFGYPLEGLLREFLKTSYCIFKEIYLVPDWLSAFSSLNLASDGVVVNMGYHSTHIAKITGGMNVSSVQRIEIGAFQAAEMLSRVMALKYSNCRLSIGQCLALIPKACYVALDFHAELEYLFNNPAEWVSLHNPTPTPTALEEPIQNPKREISLERRREMAEKLRERVHQQRLEKITFKEQEVSDLRDILKNGNPDDAEYWNGYGFNSLAAVEKKIKLAERQILEIKKKLDPEIELPEQAEIAVDFSLLEIPDAELSPEQIKEKRRARLIKATADARIRMKEQKEEELRKLAEEQELDDQKRINDFENWKKEKISERNRLSDLIKTIQRERTDLTSRKSSGKRLQAIIKDSFTGESVEDSGEDDGFGLDDSDWNIYRSKEAEEEELNSRLENLTSQLVKIESQLEAHAKEEFISLLVQEAEANKTILDKLIYDTPAGCFYLGIERIRIPEIFFQPSIIGIEQAGIIEVLTSVVKKNYAGEPINLYLTGGFARLEGLAGRIQRDLTANLPESTPLYIATIDDELAAWKGLSNFHK
jgi:actin-related protein 5